MKINFITFDHKLTGGIRVVMEIINALSERGHEMRLVTLGRPDDLKWIDLKAQVYYVSRSFPEKIFGFLYRKVFGFQPWPEEETRKILKSLPQSDVNVATISYSGFAVHRAASGIPFHYFMHYEPLVRDESAKKKVIEEAYFLPTKKIANSTWLAEKIREETGRTVDYLVFPAIDHSIFYSSGEKKPLSKEQEVRIVSLAKSKWWKGTPDALRAIQLVRDAGYRVDFSMFGNFDPSTLPDDVRNIEFSFLGSKSSSELSELYRNSDILISSSYFESFPLPQIEAMACGTAVVTTKYGTEDYAVDRKNSLVVEPRQPEKIARSIIDLIENQKLYKDLVDEGVRTAKRFTWSAAARQMEEILHKELSNAKRG